MSADATFEAKFLRRSAPPRSVRALWLATLVLLVLSGAGLYQVAVRSRRPPSFDRGGPFAASALPTAGSMGRPYPYGNAIPEPPAAEPSPAVAPTTAPPTATPQNTPATTAPATSATTRPTATSPPVAPVLPTGGTYAYAVSGSEQSTGFGSRTLPGTATIVVHGDPSVGSDELVHDLRLSGQHEEREVIRYSSKGLAFTFEGGSITFPPVTQTSQASYQPEMVHVPWPLTAGTSVSGSSAAREGSGATSRTERWTTRVVGRETITVLGQARDTWVVEIQRNTEPGSAEQVDRWRRYWYDPALGIWVKWQERFHAQRNLLLTFSYDATYTAQLTSFTPA